ncbi:M3 family metallopeptidase, partial [bacterium]|nr:M3 family metallopeptidase [bacterium]
NARTLAEEKNVPGWILTLEFPCYLAVATYAEDRALREELYQAFVTRASDQGPSAGQFDNTLVMNEILALRHEMARLLDFENYAQLSLATKMAESTQQVTQFLTDLSHRAHEQAVMEVEALQHYANEEHQLSTLLPWDMAYLSEKKRQACYAISQEEIRQFFPLPQVMDGLLSIVRILYGMSFEEIKDVDVWHPDVTCYQINDEKGQVRGYIYMDLFARPHKRGGAWMDSCQSRLVHADGFVQLPIATLTCNFAKPMMGKLPTLSHDEVLTLFHEFGHCLQHVLTQVDYLGASGIHGVEWDAVELPSQFFENWCWEEKALQMLTKHVDTGERLSSELFNRLLAAKNFQSAMVMMRQLEFSLFDFRIHQDYDGAKSTFISDTLADVRKQTMVVPTTAYNRFQHSFSHIFAGGYAAGYYSYKWAEVLSSDAFGRFEEEGVFNSETGRDFLHCILETGGAQKALQAYVRFRGRKATVDALLKHNGIKPKE